MKRGLYCIWTSFPTKGSALPAEPVPVQESFDYPITAQTNKQSSQSIRITWDSSKDALVKYYYVLRRGVFSILPDGWQGVNSNCPVSE